MGILQSHREDLAALRGRHLYLLLSAFVATRALGAWLAASPEIYRWGGTLPAGDIDLYRVAAAQILSGEMPYTEVVFDYPPLALLFVLVPALAGTSDAVYRFAFVTEAILFDAAAMALVIALARRWGAALGPWLWVIGPASIGPITWMRLDIMSATITIGALYLVARGSAPSASFALGLGGATKLYPAGLVPPLAATDGHPLRVLSAALGAGAVSLLPFVTRLPDVARAVVGFHGGRGLHVESLWGSFMFLGYEPGQGIRSAAGTLEFTGSTAGVLEVAAFICVVSISIGSVWLARRGGGDGPHIAGVMFATGVLLIGFAPVLSPQFVIWTLALAAVAGCIDRSPIEMQCMLMLPVALLTHALFPFFYDVLIEGESFPRYVLLIRNLMLVGIGASAFVALARSQTGSVER